VRVDDAAGTVVRPPGLRLDLGGSGKGHAADRIARLLRGAERWLVDCGGDLRVGGAREVHVADPFGGEPIGRVVVADAAVATSSVVARAWVGADGRRAHHLLDPATGEPAETGVLAATALAPTTVEAETLAKVALLRGPAGGRAALARHGGILVHTTGAVERVGPLRA
jgi:thiamine biosynthesis lipoprotein